MKILVIAPHPDDETLGCGGTLLRHRADRDELHWLIVTRAARSTGALAAQKAREVERVAKAYGMKSVRKLGLPTTRLDTLAMAGLIARMRGAIEAVRPHTVYLVHAGDVHTDHHAVFTAALSVLKTFYMKSLGVRRVLSYETLSSTEAAPQHPARAFAPNVYREITAAQLERKLAIMALYESELQAGPMPRSPSAVQALARYRGASIGVEYAEAFVLVREIS